MAVHVRFHVASLSGVARAWRCSCASPALWPARSLDQAQTAGAFTGTHERFWTRARRRLGDGAGTRALCKIVLLHRNLPVGVVTAGIDAALAARSVEPEAVAIEARAVDRRRRSDAVVIPISQALAMVPMSRPSSSRGCPRGPRG
jgi:hypothetical protein